MVCLIDFYCILWFRRVCEISHSVQNCPSLSPTAPSPLDFACYAKLLHVGFLPLVFFLASLIGLKTYYQAWQRAMKCSKTRILHVFELQLPLPWIAQNSLSFFACFNDKKATKTPKLAKNWLVTLARFLNVPIELKSINPTQNCLKQLISSYKRALFEY